MSFDLAQINVSRLLAPLDSPLLAEFMAGLDGVNAAADVAPGFRWRLQTEDGNATSVRAFGWDVGDSHGVIVNLTTWASLQSLADFVFSGQHLRVMRRLAGQLRARHYQRERMAPSVWPTASRRYGTHRRSTVGHRRPRSGRDGSFRTGTGRDLPDSAGRLPELSRTRIDPEPAWRLSAEPPAETRRPASRSRHRRAPMTTV